MRVSPSQISLFRSCPRKWAWKYIDKLREPPSPAAEYGTEGHKAIEYWLKTGKFPEAAKDIAALLKKAVKPGLLPTPDKRLKVEHPFRIQIPESPIILSGFVDVFVPAVCSNSNVPAIVDHKFRSDPRFISNVDALRDDVQAIIYSFAGLKLSPESVAVENRWIYYLSTGSPKNRPKTVKGVRVVSLTRTRKEVDEELVPILATVEEMTDVKKTKGGAKNVEPNFGACGEFGGCAFLDLCRKESTATSRAAARIRQAVFDKSEKRDEVAGNQKKEGEAMALIDELREKRRRAAEKANTTEEPTTSDETVPEPEKAEEKPKAKRGRPKKKKESLVAKKRAKKPEPEPEPTEETEAEPDPEVVPPTEPEPEKPGRFRLLVNCYPTKADGREVARLEILAAEAIRKVERDFGVEHWKLIEYGRDKPVLELAFSEWLDINDPVCDICLDSKTSIGQALIELLTRRAEEVIRGYI